MRIEVLLTEAEIAQEFSESMEARDLPEKFFYWLPLSARAWLTLSQDPAYASLQQCWRALADRIAGLTGHFKQEVSVISFGAGDGSKDRPILATLKNSGCEVNYFPVDASQTLLEAACCGAEDDDVETLGIKADISSPVHLVLASDAAESPKLLLVSGNTLGAFDPLDQIRHIAQCMHEGDRLVIDGELNGAAAEQAVTNSSLWNFAFAPLASIGVARDDGEIRFEHKRDERHQGLHLLTRYFHVARDLRATVSGQEILLERGERLAMNFEYFYSREAFRWLIEEHGHLKILDETLSPDGRFMVAICSR
ncbi:MAG: L-histidine N(alpha)-methyltransferase [Acidobacteria bacterium]|nr:L-histidine N(alpha)-methyltransferase [Acidobacteriota bacterium]